jgi:hypothetical protein
MTARSLQLDTLPRRRSPPVAMLVLLSLLLLLFFASSGPAVATPSPEAIHRANAGGAAQSATPIWEGDARNAPSSYWGVSGRTDRVYATSAAIDLSHPSVPDGTPAAVFQTMRRYAGVGADLQYRYPVAAGDYTVRLHFSEYLARLSRGPWSFEVGVLPGSRLDGRLPETAKSRGRTPTCQVRTRPQLPATTTMTGVCSWVSTAERGLPAELAGAIDGHLATFAAHVREGLLAASTAVGLQVMAEMMQAEVTELAGPKGRHNPQRSHTRHGTEHGTVTLGGRRLPVTRPRVRTVGDEPAEATLASYATFADTDLLTEQVTARMLAGISTRTYPVALEPVGEAVEQAATSTRSRRSRAGLWLRPPSGSPSCAPARCQSAVGRS